MWTGQTRPDDAVEPPATWHRSPVRFLIHAWFWVVLGFTVITLVVALAINNVPYDNILRFVVFSLLFFGSSFGFTLIFWPHMQFRRLPALGRLLAWGPLSGFVAVGVVSSIEGHLEPDLKIPLAVDLWFSGVIEETSKILVPILLWIFGKGLFRDPRAGFPRREAGERPVRGQPVGAAGAWRTSPPRHQPAPNCRRPPGTSRVRSATPVDVQGEEGPRTAPVQGRQTVVEVPD